MKVCGVNVHFIDIESGRNMCVWYERGFVEANVENLGYKFDRNTMKLYDNDGDEIVYKRSMTF